MQIKTIDKNGNITADYPEENERERSDRGPYRKKSGKKPQNQRPRGNNPRQDSGNPEGQQEGRNRKDARDRQNRGDAGERRAEQNRGDSRNRKDAREQQNRGEDRDRRNGREQQNRKEPREQQQEKNAAAKGRKKDPRPQKKQSPAKTKDIYDRDERIWIQYQHYGTDDLSATVTLSKEGDGYSISRVTVTAVGGKLMDLWHVPTFTEELDFLADMEEFSGLAAKLKIAKKLHREGAPAIDEAFACVCDNETDYVMFPGGCPDNDDLSAEAERFVNDLGLKVARMCNPQEAMKGYGYL